MRWNWPPIGLRQRLDRHRLGQPGHALDQQVAAGQQRDEHPLQQLVLADDGLLDLVERLLERVLRCVGVRRSCLTAPPGVICCGPPAAPPAVAIGTAKPIPTKYGLLGRVGQAGDDADHLPGAVEQRAAAVARVDRGVELDEPLQGAAALGADGAVERPRPRRRDRLPRRPSGLPTAKTASPIRGAAAQHRGHDDLRAAGRRRARRCRCRACDCCAPARPPWCRRRTRPGSVSAPSTTCSAVSTAPSALIDDAGAEPRHRCRPRPCAVTVTSDGMMVR